MTGLRVNLGCGTDIREGWLNLDLEVDPALDRSFGPGEFPSIVCADMRYLSGGVEILDGAAELVLLNHSLHYVTPDDADLVLDEVVRILEPGGRVVIVEPDVVEVLASYARDDWSTDLPRVSFVLDLIPDNLEPTDEGKLLRWATWFGERRSLWSRASLFERLTRRGLVVQYPGDATNAEWAGTRALESFTIEAVK